MPCDTKHPYNPGVEHGYATGKDSDIELGREKKMGDAEEPLEPTPMDGGTEFGPTST